tara:strand:+ start:490 stop:930 length:441 start_codon:yes stop_codon:yes gene_type:complete
MTDDKLREMEEIKQLKSRYFRLMDTKKFDDWSFCFTEDVKARYEGAPRFSESMPTDIEIEGSGDLVNGVRSLLENAVSTHQGFMPELEILGDKKASGIWAMYDRVLLSSCDFQGWGHYHEEYVKESSGWKIKSIHLTRLRVEEVWL